MEEGRREEVARGREGRGRKGSGLPAVGRLHIDVVVGNQVAATK